MKGRIIVRAKRSYGLFIAQETEEEIEGLPVFRETHYCRSHYQLKKTLAILVELEESAQSTVRESSNGEI